AQVHHRARVALFHRLAIPPDRLGGVLLHAPAFIVTVAQVRHRGRDALVGRLAIPFRRLLGISLDALAAAVTHTQVVHPDDVPLVSGLAIPADRLLVVLLHAQSAGIPIPQQRLRLDVTFLGLFAHRGQRAFDQFHPLGDVLVAHHAVAE